MGRSLELGDRKFERVNLHRPNFVIFDPSGPWIECYMVDVSEGGACLNVGPLQALNCSVF